MKYIYPLALAAAALFLLIAAQLGISGLPSNLAHLVVGLHVLIIWGTLAVVAYADEQGLMWMLGKKRILNARLLEWLHALTGLGLAGLIATGGVLILSRYSFLLATPAFIVKMVAVAALILNGFFISYVNKVATHSSWKSLSPAKKLPLLISGAVSVGGWGLALICGLLLP